jgi:hypothetical protein
VRELIIGRRKSSFLIALSLALLGFAGVASSASATFHLVKIREISSGTGPADSSYVETQNYFDFQNFLSHGAMLVRCDATCSSPTVFSPFTDVADGHTQHTVLFADSGIAAGSKDFDVNLNLDAIQAGGAVCYLSEPGFNDCVSWGNFSANSTLMTNYGTSAGTPAAALSSGMALRRSIAAGCPTLLEASDDTNNSSADFSLTTPNPRKNSVAPTEMACPSSGGGGPTGYPPASPGPTGSTSKKKKCKKHKHRSAQTSKKKKCKKKHH